MIAVTSMFSLSTEKGNDNSVGEAKDSMLGQELNISMVTTFFVWQACEFKKEECELHVN